MAHPRINMFQGQTIEIITLELSVEDGEASISIEFNDGFSNQCVIFYNISNFVVKDYSVPFLMTDLKIIENEDEKLSDKTLKFLVHDEKEDKLKFNCEAFLLF